MRYGVVEGWEQLPSGYEHRDVAGVAIDAEDRVFLICRGDHPELLMTLGTMNTPSDTGYDGKNTPSPVRSSCPRAPRRSGSSRCGKPFTIRCRTGLSVVSDIFALDPAVLAKLKVVLYN